MRKRRKGWGCGSQESENRSAKYIEAQPYRVRISQNGNMLGYYQAKQGFYARLKLLVQLNL
jgi:hypothetical protein